MEPFFEDIMGQIIAEQEDLIAGEKRAAAEADATAQESSRKPAHDTVDTERHVA
jgi:hypothetical protein